EILIDNSFHVLLEVLFRRLLRHQPETIVEAPAVTKRSDQLRFVTPRIPEPVEIRASNVLYYLAGHESIDGFLVSPLFSLQARNLVRYPKSLHSVSYLFEEPAFLVF